MAETNRTPKSSEDSGGELRVIGAISAMLPGPPAGEVWIGDDAAVVAGSGGVQLLTTDTMVEGVHADLGFVSLEDLGWKAVTTAVSDIAAMGGVPDHLLVSVAAPPHTDIEELFRGVTAAAADCGAAVVGGDLSTARQVTVVVTVTGRMADGRSPVLRSGARAGDQVFVTGPLGGASAGLRLLQARGLFEVRGSGGKSSPGQVFDARESDLIRAHKHPRARLAAGQAALECGATAMIDISDGLASDVRRIAEASEVGVRLAAIPVAPGATDHDAICGGDDYELLFTAPDPDAVWEAFDAAGLSSPTAIGVCVEDADEVTLGGSPLRDCGWEHPF